ncbi:MAG: phosphonate ABC transporter ATP-binding protein [Solirubrobacterales bacterium]
MRVRSLTVAFDGGPVLEDVGFEVEPGEVAALVGANGAGKSTLMRALVGIGPRRPRSVHVDGIDVGAASRGELRAVRRRTGMVFQRFCLAGRLSAFQNVLHGGMGRTGPRGWLAATASDEERSEAMASLERVGLAHLARRRASLLSGGEAQRVSIARAVMQRPSLVLADEPVASLDPSATRSVMELLTGVAREQGVTAILALHQLDLARRYTDRVIGLQRGRLRIDSALASCLDSELDRLYAGDPRPAASPQEPAPPAEAAA